ncbi:MAG TPA: endonuclease/exonuclease/phosphatase family protein [Thermomicrobiales bacterium]|nr:endonuclease/exonuclease/phosphatase family protein [Thermomicrobiales bacterium]
MNGSSGSTVFDTSEHVSIMSFNLKNGGNIISWIRRRALLVDVIREANPILIGTQEGYRSQLAYIRNKLPGYEFVGASRYPDEVDEYNAIFFDTSQVNVADSGTIWLSDTPDVPGSMFETEHMPRIATWALCDIIGYDRQLLSVNTHLTYEDAGIDAQVDVLIEQLDKFAPEDVDIVLTGDFNQPRHSRAWDKLVGIGFVDAWEFATSESGPRITAHNWKGAPSGDDAGSTPERRIDWIMYRPANGTTLPRNCIMETVDTHNGTVYPSDHFPIVLRNQPHHS